MQGDVDILVGKTGFNMFFRKSKMALIMGAPEWNVIYANMETKRYFQCKPGEWKVGPAVFSAMFRPSSPTSLRLTTSKKTKLKGLPCEEFAMETREASRGTDKTWKRLMAKEGTIWIYRHTNFPHQIYPLVANLLAIPRAPGFPAAMEFSRFDGRKFHELVLLGFENKLVAETEFFAPKGFTRVSDQGSALNKGIESKDLMDFLDTR